MQHVGTLDRTLDPIRQGGLSPEDRELLLARGWERRHTNRDLKDRVVAFSNPDLPGGVILRLVDIPEGTEYFSSKEREASVLAACGNATNGDSGDTDTPD